jgi:hypothetical protein
MHIHVKLVYMDIYYINNFKEINVYKDHYVQIVII